MERKVVRLRSVAAGYGNDPVFQDVNLDVCEKDFLGIIGPNGGGKTTLLQVMMGLLNPMAGSVEYISDKEINGRSIFGYLPQVSRIDKKFPITVIDVVLSGSMQLKPYLTMRRKQYRDKAEELLQKMGLRNMGRKMVGQLSGGQLQRVFLARAMISNPMLLMLDEPNSFVDNNFEKDLYDILRELNKDTGIVIVSHDLGMISSYVKTIACVNRGVHYHPSNVITEELLETYNCPIDLIAHGELPHRVLEIHKHSAP
ncbi:MAG: ABC transporter ATP-binding protein [Bacteroidetes bacterium]|nr:ABC transporter ATP-binding protein [Bacteroidota bacterium]